jgi:hypothetical protein
VTGGGRAGWRVDYGEAGVRTRQTWGLAIGLVAGCAAASLAQDAPLPREGPAPAPPPRQATEAREPGRPRSFEVTAAVVGLAPTALGSSAATFTPNGGSTPYTLFDATGELRAAAALEAHAAYNLTRTLAVEGGATYGRPVVGFTIANDAAGAPGFTAAGETLSQVFVDASLVGFMPRLAFAGGRARPFLEAGAGYLRQLHGQAGPFAAAYATDTGQAYHAGAGVKYFFRTRPVGAVRAFGLRVDGRCYLSRGGFTFGAATPRSLAVGAGLVLAF